jgi:hypothetical protein
MYVSTLAICSSLSTPPTGGMSPIGPSLPLRRMRAGMSAAASASVEPTRLGASLSWPRPSALVAGLTDVPVDLLPGVEPLLLAGRQRGNGRGGAGFARPLDARQDIARPRSDLAALRRDRRQRHRLAVQTHDPQPAAAAAAGSGRSREGIRATRTRAATRTGRTRRVRHGRGATPSDRPSGHRGAKHRDLRAAKERRPLPLDSVLIGQRREQVPNSHVLSASNDRCGDHRDRRIDVPLPSRSTDACHKANRRT